MYNLNKNTIFYTFNNKITLIFRSKHLKTLKKKEKDAYIK